MCFNNTTCYRTIGHWLNINCVKLFYVSLILILNKTHFFYSKRTHANSVIYLEIRILDFMLICFCVKSDRYILYIYRHFIAYLVVHLSIYQQSFLHLLCIWFYPFSIRLDLYHSGKYESITKKWAFFNILNNSCYFCYISLLKAKTNSFF